MAAKFIPALILCAALSAPGAPAFAAKARPQATPEAADKTFGMAMLGALISPQGDYYPRFSSGIASSRRTAPGRYEIRFERSLAGCTPVVSPLQSMLVEFAFLNEGGDDALIGLRTYDRAGTPTDGVFSVLFFCAR